MNLLRTLGKQIFFYSNTTVRTRDDIVNKLANLGIETKLENVYTASYIMAYYISNFYPYIKKVYAVGADSLASDLRNVGLSVIQGKEHNHNRVK